LADRLISGFDNIKPQSYGMAYVEQKQRQRTPRLLLHLTVTCNIICQEAAKLPWHRQHNYCRIGC